MATVQTLPHVPQLLLSLNTLTHVPPQHVLVGPLHTLPGVPQLKSSILPSVQVLDIQNALFVPNAWKQLLPHPLQFITFDVVSTHTPLQHALRLVSKQSATLLPQAMTSLNRLRQTQPTHWKPGRHLFPHAPQFSLSMFFVMQLPPQHNSDDVHTAPHTPQLF